MFISLYVAGDGSPLAGRPFVFAKRSLQEKNTDDDDCRFETTALYATDNLPSAFCGANMQEKNLQNYAAAERIREFSTLSQSMPTGGCSLLIFARPEGA
jgi:hypothetical protein